MTCERLHLHSCQSFISSRRCAGLKLSCSIYVECVSLLGCSSVDGLLSQSVSGRKRISIINSFCREKLDLVTKPCSPGSDLGEPVLKCHVKSIWNTLLKGLCNCLRDSDVLLESSGQDLIFLTFLDSCVFRIVRLISTCDCFFSNTPQSQAKIFLYFENSFLCVH